MKKVTIVIAISFFLIFIVSCSQTKYVCPDGRTVSDVAICSGGTPKEEKSIVDKAVTKVTFNEEKEKEKIHELIVQHFDAVNWKDEEAYLKTMDVNSKDFYDDRASYFRKNVKGGTVSLTINVSSIESEVTPTNATSKIRLVLGSFSPLLGKVEQKATLFYSIKKINNEWKISGFASQEETSSGNVPKPKLNVTQLDCRTGEYGWAEIVGQVTNVGDETGYNVKVYIDLKRNGQIVETDYTYVNGDNILPGQSKSFKKTFVDPESWSSCSAYATD